MAILPTLGGFTDPWPGATTVLDFVNNRYKLPNNSYTNQLTAIPGWSFSRTGVEYEANSAGSLVSFASGVPAITDLGLQVWEARTNLALQSGDWSNAAYSSVSGLAPTVTGSAGIAPDGTNTAARITFSAQFQNRGQLLTVTNGTTYTVSFWAKLESGNAALHVLDNGLSAHFNAITVTSQWQRFSYTLAADQASQSYGLQDRNASGFGSVLVWGLQVEAASFAGPYIPTTSASATRGAASASVGGLSLSYPLTIVATGVLPSITPTGIQAFLAQLDDGSNTNRSTLQTNNAQQGAVVTASGNVVQANLSLGNLAAGTPYTMALRVASNDVGASSNGSAVTKTATATLPVGPATRLQIGNGAGSSWDGFVRRVTIYPRAFSDAELQAASLTS
jgi:hypothetical protein